MDMPVSERDPNLMAEHQSCNWKLPKIPLVSFGWRRKRVSRVEVKEGDAGDTGSLWTAEGRKCRGCTFTFQS